MARILVIEDDGMVRNAVSRILTRHGHEVVTAPDGRSGMAAFVKERPDLVLTDIIMPEQEGIETILAMRRHDTAVKIIAMSGGGRLGNADVLFMARKLGAADTIAKPFTPQQLMARIETCLARDAA